MLRSTTCFLNRVLVFGGSGALGKQVVQAFDSAGWTVDSVDMAPNEQAKQNFLLTPYEQLANAGGPGGQFTKLKKEIQTVDPKYDAIVNVAGGWAGGGLDGDVVGTFGLMANQSVYSSIYAAQLAHSLMNERGTLVLCGAVAACGPNTSFMMGYGMAKAAVHHLIKSIASDANQLPPGGRVYGVLPITLDTPGNRAAMPDADKSGWTPLSTAAGDVVRLCRVTDASSPPNGALMAWKTNKGQTEFTQISPWEHKP